MSAALRNIMRSVQQKLLNISKVDGQPRAIVYHCAGHGAWLTWMGEGRAAGITLAASSERGRTTCADRLPALAKGEGTARCVAYGGRHKPQSSVDGRSGPNRSLAFIFTATKNNCRR